MSGLYIYLVVLEEGLQMSGLCIYTWCISEEGLQTSRPHISGVY